MTFISTFIDGLSLGSMYAMIALGYTMVYGIAKMLNFAHGDIIMVGCYTAIICVVPEFGLGLPGIIAIIITIIFCATMGVMIEKVAYKPLRNSSPLAVLITAIGVSFFLQNLAQLIFGSSRRAFPKIINLKPINVTENFVISSASMVTLIAAVIIMVGLMVFIKKTKIGRAMLAVSEDKDAARLMGINVNRTISITFFIGSALAAIAGICFGLTYTYVGPMTGAMPGIKAFVAAVLGGIGSIPGAMIGGIILGLIENFSKAYISTQLADAIVFSVLIIVLLIKPSGILGKVVPEKV